MTTTPQTSSANPRNSNEFTTIEASLDALGLLEDLIHEIKIDFENSKSDPNAQVKGWQENDNFGDFSDKMLSHDKEFLRKLIGLGLCLP